MLQIQQESPKIARDLPRQPEPVSTPQSCHDTLLYLGIPNLWLESESSGCLPSWCGLDRLPVSSCLTCPHVWPRFHSPQRHIQCPRVWSARGHPGLQGRHHTRAVMMVSILKDALGSSSPLKALPVFPVAVLCLSLLVPTLLRFGRT